MFKDSRPEVSLRNMPTYTQRWQERPEMFRPYGRRTISSFVIASRISDLLEAWPTLYLEMQKLRLRHARHRIISADHRLLIEAFPRSGSSFAHRAFIQANPQHGQRVATHMHRAAQVLLASRLRVPALILVRPPRDAVTSLVALAIQNGMLPVPTVDQARRCLAATLLRYARFYERIEGISGLTIAGFDEVTEDLGDVIKRVNATFGTDFTPFEHTDAGVIELTKKSRRHLSPDVNRDTVKATLAATYDSSMLIKDRKRADIAYAKMIVRRDAQRLKVNDHRTPRYPACFALVLSGHRLGWTDLLYQRP